MMVCSGPVMVRVFPAATFQDCGAPMYRLELIVTFSLVTMPPPVTVNEPPEMLYPVVEKFSPCAIRRVPPTVMALRFVAAAVVKLAWVSWFTHW